MRHTYDPEDLEAGHKILLDPEDMHELFERGGKQYCHGEGGVALGGITWIWRMREGDEMAAQGAEIDSKDLHVSIFHAQPSFPGKQINIGHNSIRAREGTPEDAVLAAFGQTGGIIIAQHVLAETVPVL